MAEKRLLKSSYFLILAGMFFLINPLFHIVDVLPDVFGYILIFFGTAKLAFFDGRMESARNKLQYLIAISAFKLLLTPAVISGLGSDKLLAAFCFAIVEIILLVMFYHDFFNGFSYIADRNNGDKTALSIPNASFLTIIFFITKTVFSVVPELYSLFDTVSDYELYENLMLAKPFILALSFFIVLIIGIFWYVSVFKMLRTANGDTPFYERLQERYFAEYLSFPDKIQYKALKRGLYIALIGCIFFLDISVDGVRVFPETAAIVLFTVSAIILGKYGSFNRTLRLAPIICVLQVLTEIFRYVFTDTEAALLSELSLTTVAVSSVVVIINAGATLLFMSEYLNELRIMYLKVTGIEAPTFDFVKLLFLTFVILQSLQVVLPNIHTSTAVSHMLFVALWIFLCGRQFARMIDDYKKTVILL
ncbi:MAG: hypothetical protein CVU97_02935 [Firmicutes bacterium HGW-Firmicutes-21]|nr:MAG: hypothetical protein CVU97_02935 [Firmicutes bacterium HGW-Firmicutes-21]